MNTTVDLLKRIMKDPGQFGLDQDTLKKIIDRARKQPGDLGFNPADKNWKWMLEQAQKQIKPEQIEAIKRVVGPLNPNPPAQPPPDNKHPEPPPITRPANPENPPVPTKQPEPAPMPMPGTQGPGPSPMPEAAPPKPPEKASRWFGDLSGLRESLGLDGELRSRVRGLFGPDTGLGRFTRGLTQETKRLGSRFLPRMRDLPLGGLMRDLGGLVPDTGNLRPLSGSLPRPSMPRFSERSGGSGGMGTFLLGGAVLGALGLILWLVVRRMRAEDAEGRAFWRKLGPWPVAPSAVRTRGEVVQAFEYLALLLLGRKAGSAHHLEIAGQLAPEDGTGQRRNAAEELALLYEHARYAPPEEELSEDELAAARRDLSLLAGARAA
jgi:hypothetical protein